MGLLSSLVQDVQGYVHSCPQPVILKELTLSAIDFCRRSEAYVYRPIVQDVTVAVPSYTFTLPTDTEIHSYKNVQFNGSAISFTDWDIVTIKDPAFPSVPGTPANYTYKNVSMPLYLVPVPDTTIPSSLLVTLALRPTITATTLNDFLLTRYKESIVSGAVRRACLMDKMVWYDPKKAALHGAIFNSGVNDANSEAESDFGNFPRRVKIRKFR
jgi:hypothetical protein